MNQVKDYHQTEEYKRNRIKKELGGYFHMSLNFKWERARKIAVAYMYDRSGGGE